MSVRGDNSLYFSTALDNSGLQKGAFDAQGIIQGLAGTISKINPFAALALGAASAFAIIASSAFKMMREFEQAMKEVETISAATQANFKGISSEVFALSKISPDSPAKLAKAYYQIVSAGYDGAAGMRLLETASKAATAGVTSTETAADGITTVLNAFKLEAQEADEVADAMFTTVRLGKTTFEQLSSTLSQAAPLAAATGFSYQELLAAVASLTKQGVPTAQAMTQIRSGIEAVSEVLGDGAAKSMTLQNAFQAIYDKAGGSQTKLKELTGRMEAMSAILGVTGANAEGAAKDLEALGNSAGSAEDAFKRMAGSNVNEWAILGNKIKATTEEVGNTIVSVSSGIAKFMNKALDETENYTTTIRKQANEFNVLKTALEDVNTPFDEKLRILKQLKEQYPEYLESLKIDKIDNDNLEGTLRNVAGALKSINDEQERRIKISGAAQKKLTAEESVDEVEALYNDRRSRFFEIIEDIKDYAAKNDIELDFNYNDNIGRIYEDINKQLNIKNPFGEGGRLIANLFDAQKSAGIFAQNLAEAQKELSKADENSENVKRSTYDNANGYKTIVEEIKKINSIEALNPFRKYKFPEIVEAVKERDKIVSVFSEIDLAKDIKSLKPFLDHETEEIKKYAEARKRALNTVAPPPPPETDPEVYAKLLKERQKQYETHQAVVSQIGQEAADKQFASLLAMGENYGEFLKNQLKETTSIARQQAVAVAATAAGLNLNRGTVSPVSTLKSAPLVLDVQIDQTSIDFIEREIARLKDLWQAASAEDRGQFEEPIRQWQEKLDAARNGSKQEENIYENLRRSLSDLTNRQLKDYVKYWKDRIATGKLNAAEEREALSNVESAEKQIGENTSATIRTVGESLGIASEMFRKFGDEDLADALEQLENVAMQFATIAANVASGNYIGAIIGVFSMIAGAMAGKSSKKSPFQISMEGLDESVKRLAKSLDRVYGAEAIANRTQMIRDLIAQRDLIQEQVELTEAAVAALAGDPLGDIAATPLVRRLTELQEMLDDINSEIYNSEDDFRELLTGTTQDSIADAIIQGFKNGKRGIEDFADDFEEMMKQALLNSLKENYIQGLLAGDDGFYALFAQMNEDGLTAAEIDSLRAMYSEILNGAESALEGMNEILNGAGLSGIGQDAQDNREGLSGAITNITEDTANLLAGYLNALRIDVREGLTINIQSMQYLSQIAQNTSYNRHLESIDNRMATVERGILEFESRG